MVRWQQTPRDAELMQSLPRCPLTALDILKLSQIWPESFSSLRRVQQRCQELVAAGQLCSWRSATTGPSGSAQLYYKLTLPGYRTAVQQEQLDSREEDIQPPTKRFLHQLSPGRHHHQRSLSKAIVHTYTVAHRAGLMVTDFKPENTYCINTGIGPLWPDTNFKLSTPTPFEFCVELDNSTESIWSQKSADSIESKMKRYLHDALVNQIPRRVLFILTGAPQRRHNIVELAGQLTLGQPFSMFYVTHLQDYLAAEDAFFAPVFSSPRNENISLLRSQHRHLVSSSPTVAPLLPQLAL